MKQKLLITLLLTISFSKINAQKLPYPIIFIHGLNSDDTTWNTMKNSLINDYNLTYGGRINFCLNQDGLNSTSNLGTDIQLYTSPTFTTGDFYVINFNISNNGVLYPTGSNDVLSNEAAIAKQGFALKTAIQLVLNQTNREKVILFGHSMGGLCAREYLQNSPNWQSDGNHHVAKLISTGTPHGGYSGSNFVFTGINSSSEAYRDLRTEYSNNNLGAYLFGGTESTNYIGTSYYNNDINCNGINNDNSTIVGLNQKNLNNDVDFAYIMGNCFGCIIQGSTAGDGVVRLTNANLGNYYNLPTPRNEFTYNASAITEIHTDLPKQIYQNMQGLDEPNTSNLAYKVDFGNLYTGFITEQPTGGNAFDWDEYKFTVPSDGNLTLTIGRPATSGVIYARINNSSSQLLGQVYTIPSGSSQFTIPLTAGQYFLEINGVPSTTSYLHPYSFSLNYTLSTQEFVSDISIKPYPNPTSSNVFFDNFISDYKEVIIYNYLGQEISKANFTTPSTNQEVDMRNLTSGVYLLKFSNNIKSEMVKIIKQ